MGSVLCHISEIGDGDAKLFDKVAIDGRYHELFVVRKGRNVFCYVNDCPHLHITLDVIPGRLMNKTEGVIQCANHGAKFEIASGRCIWGPCRGKTLRTKPVELIKGMVVLKN